MSETALSGRLAVVTGASRGIGAAIARALATAGARVAMLARDQHALETVASGMGSGALPVRCDLADARDVERTATELGTSLGIAPHILVNNAGEFPLAPLHEMAPDAFARTLDINLVAPFRILRALLPSMRDRGDGHVVTIGSIADRQTFPENGAYAASKYGARAMHEVLRAELRGTGVRASLVSPGPVDTSLWNTIDPDTRPGFTPRSSMLAAEAVADAVLWVVTRPRTVNVDELRLSRS